MSPSPTTSKYFSKKESTVPAVETCDQQSNMLSPRRSPRRRMVRSATATAAAMTLAAGAVASSPSLGRASAALVTPPPQHGRSVSPSPPSRQSGEKRARASPSTRKNTKKKKEKAATSVARTQSFSPIWAGKYQDNASIRDVKPHTLILGSHPSIASLDREQYYGHPMNAFWWIAGDCLGFRRDTGISPSTHKPYRFTSALKYDASHILPYEEQIQCMVSHGFCMWDVVASCKRPGSLDQDISDDAPNQIREFCQEHVDSIQRIVLANGTSGSKLFVKHFKDWFASGQLVAAKNEESQRAFGPALKKAAAFDGDKIELVCALGVSPAAAKFTYEEKRSFWDRHVYQPGLVEFERSRQST